MAEHSGEIATEPKPYHHQSIQNVLSDKIVHRLQNGLFDAATTKTSVDTETVNKFEHWKSLVTEIRGYEDEGLLTKDEGIEIMAAQLTGFETNLENKLLTDPITEKLNQTGYKMELARALSRSKRTKEKVVVAFGDLEGFKTVNDKLGHKAGDDALRIVAMFFEAELRTEDFIARFGGDEFGFGFIGADLEKIKERLLKIRDKELPETVRTALTALGVEVPIPQVTISLGFYEAEPGESVDEVLKKADEAMYVDKKTRNPDAKR